jgi:hypothetical protein
VPDRSAGWYHAKRQLTTENSRMDQTMATNLKTEFDRVRRMLFPRWDREKNWRVRRDWRLPSNGYCDEKKKIITVKRLDDPQWSRYWALDAILAHEICHALTRSGHGRAWQARMLIAAAAAGKSGAARLAKQIREDVAETREKISRQPRSESQAAYDFVRECLDEPGLDTWPKVLRALVDEFCLRPKEIRRRFPRARRVWDAERRERKREIQAYLHRRRTANQFR